MDAQVQPSLMAEVWLEQINRMYKCVFFERNTAKKAEYQQKLNDRIAFMKSEHGYEVRLRFHEYVFA